jgi:hypothetical protein
MQVSSERPAATCRLESRPTSRTLAGDGTITLADGRTGGSPSAAEKLATGTARDGWRWWRTDHDGRTVFLDEVRDELIRRWQRDAGCDR